MFFFSDTPEPRCFLSFFFEFPFFFIDKEFPCFSCILKRVTLKPWA